MKEADSERTADPFMETAGQNIKVHPGKAKNALRDAGLHDGKGDIICFAPAFRA